MPFCPNCGINVNPNAKFCTGCGSQLTQASPTQSSVEQSTQKPPTVLDGFIQPGIPGKVYTVFFLEDRMVFTKTGSWTTNAATTMSVSMGNTVGGRARGYAIGTLMDYHNRKARGDRAAELAGNTPEAMVAADKANFQVPYSFVTNVEVKGPNFAQELHIKIKAGKEHKFRVDKQSKDSAQYIMNVFNEFIPGKTIQK